jgi:hypothetical protein
LLLGLTSACSSGSDYCQQREAVSSSFQAVLYTAVLGGDGVRQEFVERFDDFEALFQDFAESAGEDFGDEAAAARTVVEELSSGLASARNTGQTPHDLSFLYEDVRSSFHSSLTAVDAACKE